MNLHDVVALKKPTKPSHVVDTTLANQLEQATELFSKFRVAVPSELTEKVSNHLAESRRKTFIENGGMFDETDMEAVTVDRYYGLTRKSDVLTRLAQSPRSTVADLRDVADRLGMVIMPYAALDQRSVDNASYSDRRMIRGFVEAAEAAGMDSYVIAPIELYDIHRHVAADPTSDLSFYSKEFQSVFTTIQLQVPLFRTIMGSITGLEQKVASLQQVTTQIKTQVESIQRQLTALQQEAERRRAEEAAQAAQAAAAAIVAAQAHFYAVDPLVFSVIKGTGISGNGPALIGPAWGPDFPPELAVAFGLAAKRGQRKSLEQKMSDIWSR